MLNERVCFIETKLEDLSTMRETLDKPTVAILANYPARTAAESRTYIFMLNVLKEQLELINKKQ